MDDERIIMESDRIGLLLKSLSKILDLNMKALLSGVGLTPTQVGMLVFLKARQGMETCQGDVQNELLLTNPAVTKLAKQLTERGLITVSVNERDQRVRDLEITRDGLELLEECDRIKAPLQLHTLDGFTEQEINDLKSYLERLIENVQ